MQQKFPSKNQWKGFLKILSKTEKKIFFFFLFLATSSGFFLITNLYLSNTEIRPAQGGTYIEGVIGSPRFINPIYASHSDADRDLTQLVYSGLMKYDENGKIIPDLAEKYEILEGGKAYKFYLKNNLFWSDGEPLTVDDVIFTVATIQNVEIKSPQRVNWLGVKTEKDSEQSIIFRIENSSAVFIENCVLKIIPKHIWEKISGQNFPLSIYNLKPIGSGPYKLVDLTQNTRGEITSVKMTINPYYAGPKVQIKDIELKFFDSEASLIKAFNSKTIMGFSFLSFPDYEKLSNKNFSEYDLSLPRYFAVFFNPDSKKALTENVRKAFNYGTNKEEILNSILSSHGKIVDSPILPDIYGFENQKETYQFDIEMAKSLLTKEGYKDTGSGSMSKTVKKTPSFQLKSDLQLGSQNSEVTELQKCLAKFPDVYPEGKITGYFGDQTKQAVIKFQEKYRTEILDPHGIKAGNGKVLASTRTKLNELCFASSEEMMELSFTITTIDQPTLKAVAEMLKKQWESLGLKIEIKTYKDVDELEQKVIKPRNYEMLLFGQVLGSFPDPFPFWHSSQKSDPGLNLTGFNNKTADKLLETARQTMDENERKTSLEKFQDILIADSPAVFLYNPDYIYLVSKDIKGVGSSIISDPSKRFCGIENWYIKTKRIWK